MPTATDPLAVHKAVMRAAGPEALAAITADLTPEDERLVDDYLNQLAVLPDADVAAKLRLPVDMLPEFWKLMRLEVAR